MRPSLTSSISRRYSAGLQSAGLAPCVTKGVAGGATYTLVSVSRTNVGARTTSVHCAGRFDSTISPAYLMIRPTGVG